MQSRCDNENLVEIIRYQDTTLLSSSIHSELNGQVTIFFLVETTKLTFAVRPVSLEPFRAVTLVGAWSVDAVGVGVTSFIVLALVDI